MSEVAHLPRTNTEYFRVRREGGLDEVSSWYSVTHPGAIVHIVVRDWHGDHYLGTYHMGEDSTDPDQDMGWHPAEQYTVTGWRPRKDSDE